MYIDKEKTLIDPKTLDWERLLSFWKWKLSRRFYPLFLSVFGDWFLCDEEQEIYWLDLVSGDLKKIASNVQEFNALLTIDDNRQEWLMPDLVFKCYDAGLVPGKEQCLGFKVPPIIGGSFELDNIEVLSLAVWQVIMSSVHEQTKDLPDGTRITGFRVIEGDDT